MKQVFASIYQVFGALVLLVICGLVVWTITVSAAWFGLVAAGLGAALALKAWRGTPVTKTRKVLAGIAVVFAVISGAGFIVHSDGVEAARLKTVREAEETARKAEEAEKSRLAEVQRQREAAEKAEQERRAEVELQALKKSNPDQYLAALKEKDATRWLEELKLLRPRLYAAHVEQEKKEAAARAAQRELDSQRQRPLDFLTLDMTNWYKGGFDSVMIVSLTIKSTLQFPVRDIGIRCTLSANSGTELQRIEKVIYDVVPAKATKRFNEINMGFVHSQATKAGCVILSVQR
jgi:uncharacterized protein YxeA